MSIYEAIRNRRYDAKISQNALAKKSGVPQRNISFWESGRGDPSVNDCLRLAKGLGISLAEMIEGVTLGEEESECC